MASHRSSIVGKSAGEGRGRARKGRERVGGLILNTWSVYKAISEFIVSETLHSLS